jgi:CubicO group peptidase (beta-lactamase class C family)
VKYLKLTAAGFVATAAWAAVAIYLGFYGWWMEPIVDADDAIGFHEWAANELRSGNRGTSALILLENGKVVDQYFGGPVEIDEHTLFPTASFSKWITAFAVMSLIEEGLLDLDAPVSDYLSRWELPESSFNLDDVTARRLLSHTAGLTDELGFGDYQPDEAIPALEESLRNPRASRGPGIEIAMGREPGEFLYSGGGYLILQLMIEEISGIPFTDYVRQSILEPIGMHRSSYDYLGDLGNVSPSYHVDGSLAPTYRYASAAATGFASSAADLTRLVSAALSNKQVVLSSETLATMRGPEAFMLGTAIWGLGTILYVQTPGGDFVFGHDGGNDPAINATVRINPETSDGIIVLVSGHPSLASNIASEWVLWQTGYPDFLSTARALESAVAPIVAGGLVILLLIVLWARRRV